MNKAQTLVTFAALRARTGLASQEIPQAREKRRWLAAALLVSCYCVSCGTGADAHNQATASRPATDTGAAGAAPNASKAPTALPSLPTRIVGRPVGRVRLASDYFAARPKTYQAPPLDPAATPQGQIATHQESGAGAHTGETFDVSFSGRAFGQSTEGGGVDLSYDPQVVEVVKVSVDAKVWEFFTSTGEVDNQAGKVSGIAFASLAGHSGDFPIATVTLRSKGPGDSKLHISESPTNPFASGGRRMPVALQ